MLKTIDAGEGSCREVAEYLVAGDKGDRGRGARLQAYLAGDPRASRAKAFGVSPGLSDDQLTWHEEMRKSRIKWGKDEPPAAFRARMEKDPELKWRNYYHWVISPPPADHASAGELAELARRWLERAWPSSDGWQWIYSAHDDNEGGIMHVHIIMNAVNNKTGRKAHVDKRENDELAALVQEVSAEFGMGTLPDLAERRRRLARGEPESLQWSHRSAAEIAMRRRGARSWVAEVRDEVDRAIAAAASYEDFVARMEHDGFGVEYSRRGLGFRHPESTGHDKKVMASRLGTDYLEEGIRARISFAFDSALGSKGAGADAGRAGAKLDAVATLRNGRTAPLGVERARGLQEWLVWQMKMGPRRRAANIEEILDAARVVRDEGFANRDELGDAVAAAREALGELESQVARDEEGLSAAAEILRRATRLEGGKAELASLPKGFWGSQTRKRRNGLLQSVVEDEEFCRRSLEKASGFLAERGLSGAPFREQASALVEEYGARARLMHDKSAAARERLHRLSHAEAAVEYVSGRRVTPLRPSSDGPIRLARTAPPTVLGFTPSAAQRPHRRRAADMERRATEEIRRMLGQSGEVGRVRPAGHVAHVDRTAPCHTDTPARRH